MGVVDITETNEGEKRKRKELKLILSLPKEIIGIIFNLLSKY